MSKTPTERAQAHALDASLRRMFSALEARPIPLAVRSVVDQLAQPRAQPLRKAG